MDDVSRLLGLVADPPGAVPPAPVEQLLRRARRRDAARRNAGVVASVLAVLAVAVPVVLVTSTRSPAPVEPPTVPATAEGTAAALASGSWSELPPAPVPGRSDAASAWTGRQMVVWGGLRDRREVRGDGASYDPATRTWEVLPPAPLEPVSAPLSAWTGSELLVLGGADGEGTALQQLASYDPQARQWTNRDLPEELQVDRLTTGAWTGAELVVVTGARQTWAYDPMSDRWRQLDDAPQPDGHGPVGAHSVAHDGGVWLFTSWTSRQQVTPDTYAGAAGVDVARLDLGNGSWTIQQDAGAPDGVRQLLSTPHGLLVPATGPIRPGSGPLPQDLAGWQRAGGRWTRLPHGPVDDLGGRSLWTGSAMVTADTGTYIGGPEGEMLPGAAAAYDPATRAWTRLPAAPVASTGGALVWTGSSLLLWGETFDVSGYDPSSGSRALRSGGVTLEPAAEPSPCPTSGDENSIVDYVDIVVVRDSTYARVGPAPTGAELDGTVATTRCRLADAQGRTGHQPQNGDATLLPVGTALREVAGFDPRFRLAAVVDGQTSLYELFEPPDATGSGEDVFPALRRHVVAVSLVSQADGRTELAREDDPEAVRDLVDQLLAAPYRRESDPEADVRIALRLDDGTTVDRAYVSRTGLLLPGLRLPDRLRAQLEALRSSG